MARRPRRWRFGAVYTEVKRTVDRQFLLKPTPEVRNIVGACLARAQRVYPVKIFWAVANINTMQLGRAPMDEHPDALNNMSRFDQLFYGLLSREINKLWDREGPVWSTRNRSEECIEDRSVEQQLLYALTNPVKDGLCEKVSDWEGLTLFGQLAGGEEERFYYIDWTRWWNEGGKKNKKPLCEYKKWVTVKLSPIPEWEKYSEHERQTLLRKRVRQIEDECAKERKKASRPAMSKSMRARVDPRDRPRNKKDAGPQPLCHSTTKEAADEYKAGWRDFLVRFREASGKFLSGIFDVEFPDGSFRPPMMTVCVADST